MEKIITQYDTKNFLVIIIVAILLVLAIVIVSLVFNFSLVQNITISWISTTIYSLFAYFAIDNRLIKQTERTIETPVYIDRPVIHETVREVIKEVPIQIPIENKTIEVVEKPIIQLVEVPVYRNRNIYIERKRKKLNIIHFKYIASSEAKRYHTRFCRLGKLIKKKYKIHNDNPAFFKKKHFKACKMCIKKSRKN